MRSWEESTSGDSVIGSSDVRKRRKWAPKVKTGCLTCRVRRIKCDEGKPFCRRCVSTERKCEGYPERRLVPTRGALTLLEHVGWISPLPRQDPKDGVVQVSETCQPLSVGSNAPCEDALQTGADTHRPSTTSGDVATPLSEPITTDSLGVHGSLAPSTRELNSAQDLAILLGELKVDEVGTAPYLQSECCLGAAGSDNRGDERSDNDEISNESRRLSGLLDCNFKTPQYSKLDDDDALRYFDLYFRHAHSYVPVIDEAQFFEQWRTNKASISPLILDAVLAIGAQLAGETSLCHQWLSMFSKHVESLRNAESLEVLQGILIGLKAQEAAPQPGYFHWSWSTVADCVRRGKVLGLDQHFENHKFPFTCHLERTTCWLHRRIWQVVFVCETMIGAPQGRHDLSVDPESVDFGVPAPIDSAHEVEHRVSRQFAALARLVWNIRRSNVIYLKHQKEPNWGRHPEYQRLESSMTRFASELPPELGCELPLDNISQPHISSAFIGNLHSYYHLSLILYHRGVLGFLDPLGDEAQWNYHMAICYTSAKSLCRLQEAIITEFGLNALQCMQRGFSFSVYACFSCVLIYMVAILSPDLSLSSESTCFLERHIHLVERIMDNWYMPNLQKQIISFKSNFSADSQEQPFLLRQSFMNQAQVFQAPEPPQTGVTDGLAYLMTKQNKLPRNGLAAGMLPVWDPMRIADQWHSLSAAPDPLNFTSVFPK